MKIVYNLERYEYFDNRLYYILIFSENDGILAKAAYNSDNKSKVSVIWQHGEHGV